MKKHTLAALVVFLICLWAANRYIKTTTEQTDDMVIPPEEADRPQDKGEICPDIQSADAPAEVTADVTEEVQAEETAYTEQPCEDVQGEAVAEAAPVCESEEVAEKSEPAVAMNPFTKEPIAQQVATAVLFPGEDAEIPAENVTMMTSRTLVNYGKRYVKLTDTDRKTIKVQKVGDSYIPYNIAVCGWDGEVLKQYPRYDYERDTDYEKPYCHFDLHDTVYAFVENLDGEKFAVLYGQFYIFCLDLQTFELTKVSDISDIEPEFDIEKYVEFEEDTMLKGSYFYGMQYRDYTAENGFVVELPKKMEMNCFDFDRVYIKNGSISAAY